MLPERTRLYQNHQLDGARWDAFTYRRDDIVIATTYKTGTTWTQAIIAHLLFPGGEFPAPPWQLSPWLELRTVPLDGVIASLEAQQHRRFVKTHLPLDALPYSPHAKYVFVGRDGRDVGMSLWNHYASYTKATIARFNNTPGRVGDPLPPPPADLHAFWADWCTRGWFAWETDGWPFWSHFTGTESWWRFRALPNLLFLHYADMLRDLPGSIGMIADFIGVATTPSSRREIAEAVSFAAMRERGAVYTPHGGWGWKGGSDTFLHKGTNGRWREALSAAELSLYDVAAERALTPGCRTWLEGGGSANP